MVYITGDTHGDLLHLKSARLRKGDTLIVCGDFGFVWYGDARDARALKALSRKKYTILFVDGVHENYALLEQYPVVPAFGATARQLASNVFHLLRGEVYTIEDHTYFAFGGGEEPYEEGLRAEAKSYYERCMPSEDELTRGFAVLEACGNTVDYVVTHSPSAKAGGFIRGRGRREMTVGGLNVYFNAIEDRLIYKRWYFGSLHLDRKVSGKHLAVYRDIVPVE